MRLSIGVIIGIILIAYWWMQDHPKPPPPPPVTQGYLLEMTDKIV